MNRYRISPENRKCSYEVTEYVKGDKKITCTTVWRYALFDVESDTKPVLNEGDDIYSTLDNVEFVEASDGDNYYDYENAKALCKAYGAELATYDQIEKAYNSGAEWCNYGPRPIRHRPRVS